MTFEEFRDRLGYNEASAKEVIYKNKCINKNMPRVNGKHPIDEVKLGELFVRLYKKRMAKQSFEMSFDDIYNKYKGLMGRNKLRLLVNHHDFPSRHRVMLISGSRDLNLWHRDDVERFFKRREELLVPHNFVENKPPSKTRKLSLDASTMVYFCTGRQWKIGNQVTTTLFHVREV